MQWNVYADIRVEDLPAQQNQYGVHFFTSGDLSVRGKAEELGLVRRENEVQRYNLYTNSKARKQVIKITICKLLH